MTLEELTSDQTLQDWCESFARLLDAIPRGKKAQTFGDANKVEVLSKKWLQELRLMIAVDKK